ncbi:MAG: acyltransferase family protein [Candidatus Lokiarchaeota archaeon]|nr:acyltransferase family protein [Candidatus Lokiarchaeota archaeon]MBD3200822.1 acyltransferase family protein [Candidatus Lokiarchaeota archaeon]
MLRKGIVRIYTFKNEFEILRGFAIIGVIIIHSFGFVFKYSGVDLIYSSLILIRSISGAAVPAFIFISGFCNYLKYNAEYKVKDYYLNKLYRIIPPYLIFSLLFLMFYKFKNSNYIDFLNGMPQYLLRIAVLSIHYHFWFFGLIISFYVFFPVIKLLIRKFRNNLLLLFIGSIIVQILWLLIRIPLFALINIMDLSLITKIFLSYSIKYTFLSYIVYFILGIIVSMKTESILTILAKKNSKKWIISSVIMIILVTFLFYQLHFNEVFIGYSLFIKIAGLFLFVPSIIIFLYISYKINYFLSPLKKIFLKIGKYSFSIYLIHPLIILIISPLIRELFQFTLERWIYKSIIALCTLCLSLIISYLIGLIPYNFIIKTQARIYKKIQLKKHLGIKIFNIYKKDQNKSVFLTSINNEETRFYYNLKLQ